MAKKVLDPKAQAKKQKKRAIIAGVVFLALLAYQVPKTMKLLNAKPPAGALAAPTPAATAPAATTPGAAPVPGAPAPATAAPATGGATADSLVVNADLSPTPLDGQLATMTQFSSKDPFKQQDTAPSSATAPSSTPTTSTTPSAPASPGVSPPNGSFTTPGTAAPGSTPVTAAPAPTLGTISINNVGMAVTVKTDFPTDAPLFTLKSLTAKAAKIAIAGGTLATGSTVTLPLGKPVTLMNTADGTRYVLVYVGPGDKTTPTAAAPTAPAAPTGTTSTTTTPSTSTPAGR